jgi:hypothetical protein
MLNENKETKKSLEKVLEKNGSDDGSDVEMKITETPDEQIIELAVFPKEDEKVGLLGPVPVSKKEYLALFKMSWEKSFENLLIKYDPITKGSARGLVRAVLSYVDCFESYELTDFVEGKITDFMKGVKEDPSKFEQKYANTRPVTHEMLGTFNYYLSILNNKRDPVKAKSYRYHALEDYKSSLQEGLEGRENNSTVKNKINELEKNLNPKNEIVYKILSYFKK